MALCDSCNKLTKRIDGRYIICKGKTNKQNQRNDSCKEFEAKGKVDALAWCFK